MKINDKVVTNYIQMIFPKNEKVVMDVDFNGWKVSITVDFIDDGGKSQVDVIGEKSSANICFRNWNGSLGTTTTNPIELGKANDKTVYFHPMAFQIGSVMKLEIQFMIGE